MKIKLGSYEIEINDDVVYALYLSFLDSELALANAVAKARDDGCSVESISGQSKSFAMAFLSFIFVLRLNAGHNFYVIMQDKALYRKKVDEHVNYLFGCNDRLYKWFDMKEAVGDVCAFPFDVP